MVTLDEVIKRAQKKNAPKTFKIRDLFSEQEWKDAKNVTAIGRAFYDAVDKEQVKGVKHKCRKTNNHNVYKKE